MPLHDQLEGEQQGLGGKLWFPVSSLGTQAPLVYHLVDVRNRVLPSMFPLGLSTAQAERGKQSQAKQGPSPVESNGNKG